MMIQKPKDLRRMTGTFADPGMIGSFRGFNDDYEKEYTDDEGNLTRDEVNIAQSLLGTRRTLEVLYQNLSGDPDAAPMSEAVDAMIAGEPWALSLDRGMLVVSAAPKYKLMDQDSIIVMSSDLEALLNELRPQFPTVEANQTGTAPIQREEIEAISSNTMLLSLLALLAIYLLLAWNFRGAVMPLIALAPLIVGILWTMGAVFLLFSELNMFTAMIMLMLIGLGIDFSIHLISRFYEERASGASLLDATKVMLGSTGFGVLTGGLTTAAAFFVLIIGDTRGVREMGVGMALGVLLTLISIFVALPALLTIRERVVAWFRNKRGMEDTVIHSGAAKRGLPVIGAIAVASWKRPAVVLSIFAVLVALSIWGMFENKFLWDFLELEPKGLKSVELLREFPERYGVASEGAWLITDDIETSREMKEELRDLGPVGDVSAISDVITAPEWIDENQLILRDYRASMNATSRRITGSETDVEAFAEEIDRYWDNLDLMSNLAFQAGVDRVVKVIDGITGYDMESNSTDTSAVLPKLSALLETGVDSRTMHRVAQAWRVSMRDRLLSMSNPEPVTLDMVPLVIRAAHQPKDGAHEFLVHITPRDYLYNEAAYKRFMSQVQAVDPSITSTTQIGVEVMLGTLLDARDGALFALLLIALLLLFHFRGPEGLLAMIPLIGGTLFMMGTMYLIGMKYNYMNFIAMPVILGIGIDDGVHALHRWREEIGDPRHGSGEFQFCRPRNPAGVTHDDDWFWKPRIL